jgi:hypothetical protein
MLPGRRTVVELANWERSLPVQAFRMHCCPVGATSLSGLARVDAIPHAAVGEAAGHVVGEKVVWESHFDATDRIEPLDERRLQPDVNAGEVIFDLRQFACADDRDHRRRALPKPRQGNLGTTRV